MRHAVGAKSKNPLLVLLGTKNFFPPTPAKFHTFRFNIYVYSAIWDKYFV